MHPSSTWQRTLTVAVEVHSLIRERAVIEQQRLPNQNKLLVRRSPTCSVVHLRRFRHLIAIRDPLLVLPCRRYHSPLYSLAPKHTHLSPTHSLTPDRLVSMFLANDESCLQAMYVFWTKYSHSQRFVNPLHTYIRINIKLNFILGLKISTTAHANQPTFDIVLVVRNHDSGGGGGGGI
jgi:hypothetical protein